MLSLIPRMSDSDASGLMNRADPRLEGSVFDNPVNQLTLHPTPLMLMVKAREKRLIYSRIRVKTSLVHPCRNYCCWDIAVAALLMILYEHICLCILEHIKERERGDNVVGWWSVNCHSVRERKSKGFVEFLACFSLFELSLLLPSDSPRSLTVAAALLLRGSRQIVVVWIKRPSSFMTSNEP